MRSHAKSNIRSLLLLIAVTAILPASGCRICCDPDTQSYPTYGGIWERTRRDGGRVGSIVDPAGARASTLVQRDDPRTPDERDRERRKNDPNAISLDPPEAEQSTPPEPSEPRDKDAELRERIEKLRKERFEDINIEPGDVAPPILF